MSNFEIERQKQIDLTTSYLSGHDISTADQKQELFREMQHQRMRVLKEKLPKFKEKEDNV